MGQPVVTKEQYERATFERLALLAGYDVPPESIRQDAPPRPDIECALMDGTPLAVELVSLDAQGTQRRLSLMDTTDEAWTRALASQLPIAQERLRVECSDLFLSVLFDQTAGTRERVEALRDVQVALLEKPSGFKGELFDDLRMPENLILCEVHRGIANGPRILKVSGGHWHPPQYDLIERKITRKRYDTDARLELFAYSEHDGVGGSVDSLATIIATINQHLPGSRFFRVRVFDLFRQKQEYVSP